MADFKGKVALVTGGAHQDEAVGIDVADVTHHAHQAIDHLLRIVHGAAAGERRQDQPVVGRLYQFAGDQETPRVVNIAIVVNRDDGLGAMLLRQRRLFDHHMRGLEKHTVAAADRRGVDGQRIE